MDINDTAATIELLHRKIRDGGLKNFAPVLPLLFRFGGKPFSLQDHFLWEPLFNTVVPRRRTVKTARQVGKSLSSGVQILTWTGLMDYFNILYVAPRMEQTRVFSVDIIEPFISGSPIFANRDKKLASNVTHRVVRPGNNIYFSYAFLDAERIRSKTAGALFIDESLAWNTLVDTYDLAGNLTTKEIRDIRQGDLVNSFTDDGVIPSVVAKDASYHGVRDCYKISTVGGREVVCTLDHPLVTDKGVLRLDEMVRLMYSGEPGSTYAGDSELSLSSRGTTQAQSDKVHGIVRVHAESSRASQEMEIQNLLVAPVSRSLSLCISTSRDGHSSTDTCDDISSIAHVGSMGVWDIEVVGTENYLLHNGVKSFNCQDIDPSFLPILSEVLSASKNFGVIQQTGTPKTKDNNLENEWDRSSQAEWCIPCMSCKKLNVAGVEYDLLGMIRPEGLSCAKCGKLLNTRLGWWEHRFPSRRALHEGYHAPQVVFPIHCEKQPDEAQRPIGRKWFDILQAQADLPTYRFYNEKLGESYDNADELISKKSLIDNSVLETDNDLEKAAVQARDRNRYHFVAMGVDWGGGGESGLSRTAIAILGFKRDYTPDVLYLERIATPMRPEDEAGYIASLAKKCNVDIVADDYCGAGSVKEIILLQCGFPTSKLMPVAYVAQLSKKMMELVPVNDVNATAHIKVPKAKSLSVMASLINQGYYKFPKFDTWDKYSYPDNFLSLVQEKRDRLSSGASFIVTHKANKPDDLAHAVNFASLSYWFITKHTPNFASLLADQELEHVHPA